MMPCRFSGTARPHCHSALSRCSTGRFFPPCPGCGIDADMISGVGTGVWCKKPLVKIFYLPHCPRAKGDTCQISRVKHSSMPTGCPNILVAMVEAAAGLVLTLIGVVPSHQLARRSSTPLSPRHGRSDPRAPDERRACETAPKASLNSIPTQSRKRIGHYRESHPRSEPLNAWPRSSEPAALDVPRRRRSSSLVHESMGRGLD